jgi:hypothetical protein
MIFRALPSLAVICVISATTVADAKPASARHAPMASARAPLQVQTGRQAGAGQPFKPLQLQVAPRKLDATPGPAPSPEFNPLKRRRMAMPVTPDSDLAF